MALPLTTDQPDRSVAPADRQIARDFILARLGSLFAFAPVGVWTLIHLWNQLAAYESSGAWQGAVTAHSSNASAALAFVLVLGPLLWHTVWGIVRMLRSRPKPMQSGFSNFRYVIQRLSAVGLLAFLGAHLYLAWFEPRILEGRPEPFAEIAREMHFHTPTLIVYVLGVLAIAYHLANGLWSFLTMGWGVTVGKSGQRWLEWVSVLFFLVLLAIGWAAVYGLYSAGAAYASAA
ncbi:MAG TPA: succinate dehydrogenase [Myxococcales bacterium]|jgi:succinate dehydrogenase / fumarate reductase cytochrome b subunit|nr:succinate dehydrogenase [Myxococcales bacterium]